MFVWGGFSFCCFVFIFSSKSKVSCKGYDVEGKRGGEGTERYFSLKKVEGLEHIPK
jgi:transcriptional regulator CtsR